jgi:hypothetical protein
LKAAVLPFSGAMFSGSAPRKTLRVQRCGCDSTAALKPPPKLCQQRSIADSSSGPTQARPGSVALSSRSKRSSSLASAQLIARNARCEKSLRASAIDVRCAVCSGVATLWSGPVAPGAQIVEFGDFCRPGGASR